MRRSALSSPTLARVIGAIQPARIVLDLAQMRLGFAGDTAMPILPMSRVGSPRRGARQFVHVAPPSVDL